MDDMFTTVQLPSLQGMGPEELMKSFMDQGLERQATKATARADSTACGLDVTMTDTMRSNAMLEIVC